MKELAIVLPALIITIIFWLYIVRHTKFSKWIFVPTVICAFLPFLFGLLFFMAQPVIQWCNIEFDLVTRVASSDCALIGESFFRTTGLLFVYHDLGLLLLFVAGSWLIPIVFIGAVVEWLISKRSLNINKA